MVVMAASGSEEKAAGTGSTGIVEGIKRNTKATSGLIDRRAVLSSTDACHYFFSFWWPGLTWG